MLEGLLESNTKFILILLGIVLLLIMMALLGTGIFGGLIRI